MIAKGVEQEDKLQKSKQEYTFLKKEVLYNYSS